MQSSHIIRQATSDDAKSIARFKVDYYIETQRLNATNHRLAEIFTQVFQDRVLKQIDNGIYILLLTQDNVILGYVSYSITNTAAQIKNIYLAPQVRGKGLGKKLYQAVSEDIRLKECTIIITWLLPEIEQVKNFFEKLGYAATGQIKKETIQSEIQLEEHEYKLVLAEKC